MGEREMIELIRARDERGAEELLRRFGALIRYVIAPILPDERDREDCLAEVLMRIWDGIGGYDPERGSWRAYITAAARVLRELGCRSVLVKGGHLAGTEATDWLFIEEEKPMRLVDPRVETRNTHGTGCTLSSAIAAYLALSISFEFAVRLGKTYVNKAIANGAGIEVGHGHGPVNHLFHPSPLHKIILGYE